MLTRKKKMDGLEAAGQYAHKVHEGERRNFGDKLPYVTHVIAVSQGGHSEYEKILGRMHDVPEKRIKEKRKAAEKDFNRPLRRQEEEELTRRELLQIKKDLGPHIAFIDILIADLDAMSKRSWEKDTSQTPHGYMDYIRRLAGHAKENIRQKRVEPTAVVRMKKTDLDCNISGDENPKGTDVTKKDKERIKKYRFARAYLDQEFPNVQPRPPRIERKDIRSEPGRPGMNKRKQRARTASVD